MRIVIRQGLKQAGSRTRRAGTGAHHALAGAILLFAHGHAQAAEELIEMAQDVPQWVMPAKDYASTRFSGLQQQPTQ